MHSIESIISITFLLIFFGVCINIINFQQSEFDFFKNNFYSISKSNYCSTLVDFSYIESIKEIKEDNCFSENNKIFVDELKESYSIASSIMKEGVVTKSEHYK
jgi:hypothetical protein